jgi:Replication-relaxation
VSRSSYLTPVQLSRLDERLSARDRQIVRLLSDLVLMSGAQLRRVFFNDENVSRSSGQLARRTLRRLTCHGLLVRLERRIGGVRSGSEGFTYRLAPAGQRLVAMWSGGELARGRRAPEPGERFLVHRLAVSEFYVRLFEAEVRGELELLQFQGEPACWRGYVAPLQGAVTLKPDAFVRVGVGELELWWFIEIDRGTVSQATRARQADAYRALWRAGSGGEVMPRVLWVTPSAVVAERAVAAIRLGVEPAGLFRVTTADQAVVAIAGREEAT